MRKKIIRVVCMLVVIGLAACGGGGGGSSSGESATDTMTLTVTDLSTAVTTTYTEGGYNTYGYLDPNLSTYVTGSDTWVLLSTGSNGSAVDLSINIVVRGNTPGSYPTGTTSSSTYISYTSYTPSIQPYNSRYSSSTGTVTLSKVGNLGETITGSFYAVVALMSSPSNKRGI